MYKLLKTNQIIEFVCYKRELVITEFVITEFDCTLLPYVSNLLNLGKDARKYFSQFLLYSPVCGYFISLFGFLLYCPVCSYFIALFVFYFMSPLLKPDDPILMKTKVHRITYLCSPKAFKNYKQ
jgi:hypothetical protein